MKWEWPKSEKNIQFNVFLQVRQEDRVLGGPPVGSPPPPTDFINWHRWGKGPPEISQTTGPIYKFQTPFDNPVRELSAQGKKKWPGSHWWRHRSGQSKNFRLFGLGDIGE